MNTSQNPYIGPRTFLKEEGHLFFGRDREARDLIALVVSEQLVLFYAQSGAGKSSLINTRLIPGLEDKEYEILPVGRLGGDLPAGHETNNVFVYNLMRSLVRQDIDPSSLSNLSLAHFLNGLNVNSEGYYYEDNPKTEVPHNKQYVPWRHVLIIDQFEELFSTHPEAWEKREGLFRELAQAIQGDPYLWVVLVMREEYIAALDPYAHLLMNGLRTRYYMQRLSREAALTAIKRPVQELRPYAEGVAEKLVDDLCSIKEQRPDGTQVTQPGQYVEAVQLQVVCYRLWENLSPTGEYITEQDLHDVGDVDQSLAKYYEERVKAVAESKNVKERLIREWFEEKLITADGIRNLVRQEPHKKSGGLDDDVIQALQSDLVRAENRGGATWYELTHDRLVEPILENNRNWFNQNLSPLQRQAALWKDQGQNESWLLSGRALAEVERWEKDHQIDLTDTEKDFIKASQSIFEREKREQRARRLARLIIILVVIAVTLAVFAYQANVNAKQQEQTALAGQLAILSGSILEEFPQSSILLAIEANSVIQPASAQEALRSVLKEPHGLPLPGHERPVNTLAFSPDGRWLATGSDDPIIHLLDMRAIGNQRDPLDLTGHTDRINILAFSPDGHWLATSSLDKTVRLWDLTLPDPSDNPRVLSDHEHDINALAFSPNGRWLATGSEDDIARLWDLSSSNPTKASHELIGPGGGIQALAFSPDVRWLATGGGGSHADPQLWDLSMLELSTDPVPMPLPGHKSRILTLTFSPDGRWLATGSMDQTAQLWDMEHPGESPRVLRGHSNWVNILAFSKDERWLATGSGDNTARLWDLKAEDPAVNSIVLVGHTDAIRTLAFHPDGSWLATGSQDNSIRVWDVQALAPTVDPKVLRGHDNWVNALAFSADGRWLASGARDGSIRLWDQINADPAVNPVVLNSHVDSVITLAFSPDERWLATGSNDMTVRLWRMPDLAAKPKELHGHLGSIQSLAFSPDGHWLVTGSIEDKAARLWDLQAEDPSVNFRELSNHTEWIKTVAFSADGHWLATGSVDDTALLWDLTSADPSANPRILGGHEQDINALAFSPDGRWLATGSGDNIARLWDLRTADTTRNFIALPSHKSDIFAVNFSPDGRWLATGSDDATARLWDLETVETAPRFIELRGHSNQVNVLAFSHNGRWLATGSWDGTARLWDLQASRPAANPQVLPGHRDWITTLAFSPDSRWLATGSRDKTAHLWDLNTHNPERSLVVLSGHEGGVNTLAFSRDGHWLATGSDDKTIRMWLVQLEELEILACRIAGRNLSQNEWQGYFPGVDYIKTCEQWPESR